MASKSMSGVDVDQEIVTLYEEIKLRKTHKWVTFMINDKKTKVIIEKKGDKVDTTTKEEDKKCFEKFAEEEFKKDPRYAIYDFSFTDDEGRLRQAIGFICWNPDDGTIGKKMIYAASKDAVIKCLSGIKEGLQANDRSDLDYDEYVQKVCK